MITAPEKDPNPKEIITFLVLTARMIVSNAGISETNPYDSIN